jgi:hypothetical protein
MGAATKGRGLQLASVVGFLALCGSAGGYLWVSRGGQRDVVVGVGGHELTIPAPAPTAARRRVPKIVYLERRGAVLTGGEDASHENRSSVVASYGKAEIKIPEFSATDRRWGQIVACVQKQFAAFDVLVTDVRPSEPGYVMAVFGGRPTLLGADKHVAGLAPYNGLVIPDAVVLIFSAAVNNQARIVCETAAMEIAHAYGLDHEFTCKDPMGYLEGCGPRSFRDEAFPCGEKVARPCKDGSATQNSVQRLAAALGWKDKARAPVLAEAPRVGPVELPAAQAGPTPADTPGDGGAAVEVHGDQAAPPLVPVVPVGPDGHRHVH